MIERTDLEKSPSSPPASTFVVRLWHEWTAAGPRWRGRVEHLQSGESRAFLDVEGLVGFVNRFVVRQDEADEPARQEEGE